LPNEILSRAIDAVCDGDHLTADHAAAVLAEVMEGRAGEVQTAAFLVALRAKGETVPELVGLARTMRALAAAVETGRDDLVDTAGTGGGPSTFNVSTAAALVAAGAGCAVAKHGNRSNTSRCGSADLLEGLGVEIELPPDAVASCIDQVGFGFMFAPRHHKAMAHVVPVRKELAVRTIFNFLGPLTNPAGASRQLLGVSDRRYQETVAEALLGLGSAQALVVSADDGIDELSVASRTRVIEVKDGRTEEWFADPAELGFDGGRLEDVAGGTPEENAATVRAVLDGEPGPGRDLVTLNAGAAIYVGGRAPGLGEGVAAARQAIDSGAAKQVLGRLVETTRSLAEASRRSGGR
jgi:anthranilate phosphoribosyltransferase